MRNGVYRGRMVLSRDGRAVLAVNSVGLEQYLYGVVPAEMPASWPAEALKAQAVVARSYALRSRRPSEPYDVFADVRSQVYRGVLPRPTPQRRRPRHARARRDGGRRRSPRRSSSPPRAVARPATRRRSAARRSPTCARSTTRTTTCRRTTLDRALHAARGASGCSVIAAGDLLGLRWRSARRQAAPRRCSCAAAAAIRPSARPRSAPCWGSAARGSRASWVPEPRRSPANCGWVGRRGSRPRGRSETLAGNPPIRWFIRQWRVFAPARPTSLKASS